MHLEMVRMDDSDLFGLYFVNTMMDIEYEEWVENLECKIEEYYEEECPGETPIISFLTIQLAHMDKWRKRLEAMPEDEKDKLRQQAMMKRAQRRIDYLEYLKQPEKTQITDISKEEL